VFRRFAFRTLSAAAGLALGLTLSTAAAPAALDVNVGAQKVVNGVPVAKCNASAKSALTSVLGNALEIGTGDTGEWKGTASPDSSGNSFGAGAIHCYPLDDGYVVTFTCAAQVPPNADTASAICDKLTAAFGSGR